MTKRATKRSDTARETMRKFDGVCSFLTMKTAMQTRALPMTVPTIIRVRIMETMTFVHTEDVDEASFVSPFKE